MTYSIVVSDSDKYVICYRKDESIIVRGIISLKRIDGYIDDMSFDALIREVNSFDDIKHIIDDYEHNN